MGASQSPQSSSASQLPSSGNSGQKKAKHSNKGASAARRKAGHSKDLVTESGTGPAPTADALVPAARTGEPAGRETAPGGYAIDASLEDAATPQLGLAQRIRVSFRGVSGLLTGLPLLPIDDSYEAGMLLAAFIVLAVDMLIDVGAGVLRAVAAFCQRFVVEEVVVEKAGNDRLVRMAMKVREPVPPARKAGFVLRIVTLTVLAATWFEETQHHQTELAVTAVSLVFLDILIEVSTMSFTRIRAFVKRIHAFKITRTDRDTDPRN